MVSPVGETSFWVAALRAIESEREDRLIFDPYARILAGERGFAAREVAREQAGGDDSLLVTVVAIRTRFVDDGLRAAIKGGIRQLVILAAGMDSRAFRMEFPPGFKTWELDRQEIFDIKQPLLTQWRPKTGCTRYAISVDLQEDWTAPLLESGFDPSRPTAFLIEGLLVYLEEVEVHRLLERLDKVASKGSWLATDLPGTELLESEIMAPMLKRLEEQGTPWKFSTRDPEALFKSHGWNAHCATIGDEQTSYGRWPYPPIPPHATGAPRSYLVSATR